MKIMFLCSSLEPSGDGVGDYTRRLAGELIKQGNSVAIISLNDKFIASIFWGIQRSDGIDVPVTRIPQALSVSERFLCAKRQIEQFSPDWLSLQYVPFGYHPKGLPFRLSRHLLSLGTAKKWHIMFHELWVGMAKEESKKLIWWGRLQQYLIKSLILRLKPKVVHTQTKLYQEQLKKLGFNAGYLPLFGNIPVANPVATKTISLVGNDKILFVVFGSIHSGAPIAEFARDAAIYAKEKGIPIRLIFIGRCGPEQERWAASWEAEGLECEILGERPAEYISKILLNSTIGISATALAVIEKSGSVAAMRDHGLTVLSVSKPWQPTGVLSQQIPDGIIAYQVGNLEECIDSLIRVPKNKTIADISIQLSNALSNI